MILFCMLQEIKIVVDRIPKSNNVIYQYSAILSSWYRIDTGGDIHISTALNQNIAKMRSR